MLGHFFTQTTSSSIYNILVHFIKSNPFVDEKDGTFEPQFSQIQTTTFLQWNSSVASPDYDRKN